MVKSYKEYSGHIPNQCKTSYQKINALSNVNKQRVARTPILHICNCSINNILHVNVLMLKY